MTAPRCYWVRNYDTGKHVELYDYFSNALARVRELGREDPLTQYTITTRAGAGGTGVLQVRRYRAGKIEHDTRRR